MKRGFIAFGLTLCLLITSCSKSPITTSGGTKLIATFTGSGDSSANIFTTSGNNWKIEYSCQFQDINNPKILFSLSIGQLHEGLPSWLWPWNDNMIQLITSTTGDSFVLDNAPYSGIEYYNIQGRFRLGITGQNANWTINVYE